jgi:hypothetical protein
MDEKIKKHILEIEHNISQIHKLSECVANVLNNECALIKNNNPLEDTESKCNCIKQNIANVEQLLDETKNT